MKISEVMRIIDAQLLCGDELLDKEVNYAFGADLMSDVLAFVQEKTLLLTGMVNPHVIRTAEMLEVQCIIFVRGKFVPNELVERAKELNMVLLCTDKTLYTSCGLLYSAGLPGCTGVTSHA